MAKSPSATDPRCSKAATRWSHRRGGITERFGTPTQADGGLVNHERHIITNRVARLTGHGEAQGSSITLINDNKTAVLQLSFSRYGDRIVTRKVKGTWRIAHRRIITYNRESGTG